MKVYTPIYTGAGLWIIEELETEKLKRLGSKHARPADDVITRYTPETGHYGTLYHNPFYTTIQAAEKYIAREYVSPREEYYIL